MKAEARQRARLVYTVLLSNMILWKKHDKFHSVRLIFLLLLVVPESAMANLMITWNKFALLQLSLFEA
jgi:hypothetical protein